MRNTKRKLALNIKIIIPIVIVICFVSYYLSIETLPSYSYNQLAEEVPSIDPRLQSSSVFYGEEQSLGQGYVRSWVKVDDQKNPSDIGVSITEAALSSLPQENTKIKTYPLKLKLQDGIGFSTFEYELKFPEEIGVAPFTHVSLNSNPHGHGPKTLYDQEHLDYHFNLVIPEERHAIVADDYDTFAEVAYKEPPKKFLPSGYKTAPMTAEPRMGIHWFDSNGSEFHGISWTKSFNIGSYDGEIVFWEPMISVEYLAKKPNISIPIKQPLAYPKSGYYPTSYSINYANEEYSVSLNGLKFQSAES